ncbi:MAG: dicarboxylate/amino acid:cation symporter [Gammaproteobacteria bacterium]|nr:dicarboxylate/amino acid:cation symporter [Gammaproteobacteria bacterium]
MPRVIVLGCQLALPEFRVNDIPSAPAIHNASRPLHQRIFLGLAVGALAGLAVNTWSEGAPWVTKVIDNITQPVGQIFLSLLLMVVVPLVFSSLALGVAGLGDMKRLGRVGVRSFLYCFVISAISVLIGLALANTFEPGRKLDPEVSSALQARYAQDAGQRVAAATSTQSQQSPLAQVVATIIPRNPIQSVASDPPNMLHLMFFAMMVGIAMALLPPQEVAGLTAALEGLFAISSKLISLIMEFAPYAVACLLFGNLALFGIDLLASLGWFLLTVLLGLGLHMFGVYSIAVRWLGKMSPRVFFRAVRTAALTAFSTSSSNATLPTTLAVAEQNLGIPKQISSFVLTVGATANQNGTALYEGVTVLFLAQLAGVDLTLGQQLMVVYLAILGGIGTAGVPAGSIPFIIGILATIGVDPGLIAIVLGVDRVLDMCRTTLNVTGDLTAAVYVARVESEREGALSTRPVAEDS